MPLLPSSPCFLLRVQLLVFCCSFEGNAPFILWLLLRFSALDFLQLGFDVLRRGFYVNYIAWADNLSSILNNSWLLSLQTVLSYVLSLSSPGEFQVCGCQSFLTIEHSSALTWAPSTPARA